MDAELRTLVKTIDAYCVMLLEPEPGAFNDEQRNLVEMMRASVERFQGNFSAISRAELGALPHVIHEAGILPISIARGYTELLLDEGAGSLNPKQRDLLRQILTTSELLLNKIRLLFEIARRTLVDQRIPNNG